MTESRRSQHHSLKAASQWIDENLPPEEPMLVGVSGGRDSVALLHLLAEGGAERRKRLTVCHLDHALRAESEEEAQFVAELAQRYGCAFAGDRVDVGAEAQRKKISVEAAAREARYAFFARAAQERGCRRLLLAHHADDQVETFLFNLFRGAGAAGLQGMQRVSARAVGGAELEIVRPLLGVWRVEIDAYAAAHRLEFREDLSNFDLRYTRNRLRHEVLPALEAAFGRDVRRAVWRAAELCTADNRLIEALPEMREPRPEALSVAGLREKPPALQRRIIHRWLREQRVSDVSFDDVENVRELLSNERRAKVNLARGWHARRRAGRLFLQPPLSPTA